VQLRLCARYRELARNGKQANVVTAAIAASANACSRGLGWNIQKNTKGQDVSLLIKAVIAMARDIATAVDSAGLLPQTEEALAQVEE